MILVSTIGFPGMRDLLLWLDLALSVKSKMAAIYPGSKNKLISFSTQ